MYRPDRVILRKIREYDPELSVVWNERKSYFELWRRMVWGRRLITPVTESIYKDKGKKTFTPLDERILVWLYFADSWRKKSSTEHALEGDRRWKEQLIFQRKAQKEDFRHRATEAYHALANFHFTKYPRKNKSPTQALANRRKKLHTGGWIKPDSKGMTTKRMYARSTANAIKYFGGKA